MRFRHKLSIVLVMLVLVPLLAAGLLVGGLLANNERAAVDDDLSASLAGASAVYRSRLDSAGALAASIASRSDVQQGLRDGDVGKLHLNEIGEDKIEVLQPLLEILGPHALIGTNTSSLSITEMGDATLRPDKVIGFHYFYPASVMRLIEVVEGEETSDETVQTTINFVQQIRKMPIRCGEVPGFVVNRILNSAASEIWRHKDETGLSVQDIDKEIAEARVTPMGPFFLSDLLGLDTVLHVAEHLHESYGDRFYVSPEMQSLVAAGNFGQKTGKGFYDHGKNGS